MKEYRSIFYRKNKLMIVTSLIYFVSMILCIAVLFAMTSCSSQSSAENYTSRVLGVDFSEGQVLKYINTHGGFHGDGECYIKISLTEDQIKSVIKEVKINDMWRELPISDELNSIVQSPGVVGGVNVKADFKESLSSPIETGYYYFNDRHVCSQQCQCGITDKRDYTKVFGSGRASYNFTVAVFDIKTRTLYFYSLDT